MEQAGIFLILVNALIAFVAVSCAGYISVLGMYHVHRTKKVLEAEINTLPERIQEVLAKYQEPFREAIDKPGLEPNTRQAIVEDEDEFELWSNPGRYADVG